MRPGLAQSIRNKLAEQQNGRCWYCAAPMRIEGGITIDHIHPRAAGGKNDRANLVAACKRCNARKGRLLLEVFRKSETDRRGGQRPVFTKAQVNWLRCHGFEMPPIVPLVFYGESLALNKTGEISGRDEVYKERPE